MHSLHFVAFLEVLDDLTAMENFAEDHLANVANHKVKDEAHVAGEQ